MWAGEKKDQIPEIFRIKHWWDLVWELQNVKDDDQGSGLGTWVDGGSFYQDGQDRRMMSSTLDMLKWQYSEVEMLSRLLVMQIWISGERSDLETQIGRY